MRLIPAALIFGIVACAPAQIWAQPEPSFNDLAKQLEIGKRVRIEDRSGAKTTGRLTAVSAERLAIETSQGDKRFAPADIASVAVRHGGYGKRGALIGALAGAVAFIPFTQGEHGDKDAFVLGGLLGAAGGAITGALIPRMKTVYRAPASTVGFAISPAVSTRGAGAIGSLSW